jgi:hypothetical protein
MRVKSDPKQSDPKQDVPTRAAPDYQVVLPLTAQYFD